MSPTPTFRAKKKEEQLRWRAKVLPNVQGWGKWNGTGYPHILPRADVEQTLWPGIQSGGQLASLQAYLDDPKYPIQAHTGRANLLSSWTLCANLYFPFGRDPDGLKILAAFLKDRIGPSIVSVEKVELEHAEGPPLDPGELLGETGGSRGSHQTSPDVAFIVRLEGGEKGIVLTEVKYTEHSFYSCSARKMVEPVVRQALCGDLVTLRKDPCGTCLQHQLKKRRYWDHLEQVFTGWHLNQCPAATAGYQLFRQQALAEALATSGKYRLVVSSVAYDRDNHGLMECLRRTGIPRVDKDWDDLFSGKARFVALTHQDWVSWVRAMASKPSWCTSWLDYVSTRYGY